MRKRNTIEVEERFNALLEDFGRVLRRAIVRLCPHDKGLQFDDIEQEARMRLWRALQSEREITNYASYLYKIAATATIDAMRRAQARHEEQFQTITVEGAGDNDVLVVPAPLNESPERVTESQELMQIVSAALARLSDDRRRAVGLHLEGMTSQEIADLLGWTEPKSRNLVYRGLQELRKSLRDEGIEYEIE